MSRLSPRAARLLANFALVAFDERQDDPKEIVHPGVEFRRLGKKKPMGIFEAKDDDLCMIRKREIVDYARRCLRDSLTGGFDKLDKHIAEGGE